MQSSPSVLFLSQTHWISSSLRGIFPESVSVKGFFSHLTGPRFQRRSSAESLSLITDLFISKHRVWTLSGQLNSRLLVERRWRCVWLGRERLCGQEALRTEFGCTSASIRLDEGSPIGLLKPQFWLDLFIVILGFWRPYLGYLSGQRGTSVFISVSFTTSLKLHTGAFTLHYIIKLINSF